MEAFAAREVDLGKREDGLKQREAYRQWVMVPIGRNPAEWSKNEAELR